MRIDRLERVRLLAIVSAGLEANPAYEASATQLVKRANEVVDAILESVPEPEPLPKPVPTSVPGGGVPR